MISLPGKDFYFCVLFVFFIWLSCAVAQVCRAVRASKGIVPDITLSEAEYMAFMPRLKCKNTLFNAHSLAVL